jgi:chromosome segregation ATPase
MDSAHYEVSRVEVRVEKLEAITSEVKMLEQAIGSIDAVKIESVRAELASFQSHQSDLYAFLGSLLAARSLLIETNTSLLRKIETLVMSQTTSIEIEKKKDEQIVALKFEAASFERTIKGLEGKNSELELRIASLTKELGQRELMVSEYISKVSSLEIEKRRWESEVLSLTKQVEQTREESAHKISALENYTSQISTLEKKNSELQAIYSELTETSQRLGVEKSQFESNYNEQLHVNSLLVKENLSMAGRIV